MCKMIISKGIFFIFSKFWFSGLSGGQKGEKWSKMGKNCLSCSISQETYIIWSSFVICKCKMIIFSGFFFYFFKILIFQVVRKVKGEKMTQNDKKLFLSYSISQETYIIWLWFLVHMCNVRTSQDAFFIVLKFWFFWLLGGY